MQLDRPSHLELRDYQRDVCRSLWRSLVKGNSPATLLVAPCGSGKTVCLAAFIRAALEMRGWRTLFLCPRREIVHQAAATLSTAGLGVGTIMAGDVLNPDRPVQVASVASYLRWRGRKVAADYPEVVVTDEAHGSMSKGQTKLLTELREHGCHILGATATPIRGDGQGLGRLFHDMVEAPGVQALTDMGYLLPMHYYVGIVPDVSGVKLVARDYSQDQLQAVLDKDSLVGDVVDNYLRLARNRKALLFATGVQHSMHLRDRLRAAGVRAEHIDGTTPKLERDRIHGLLTSDLTDVVCNANVYVEGTDLPVVSCIIDAQPTKSVGRFLQKAGRGLRPYPGQSECYYLDHSGNVYEHGRVEMERNWKLTQGREMGDEAAKQARKRRELACDSCGFMYAGAVCPKCGTPRVQKWTAFKSELDAELKELEDAKRAVTKPRAATPEEEAAWYGAAISVARKWGKRDGFAAYAFKDRFGFMPPFGWTVLPGPITPEVESYMRSRLIRAAKRVRAYPTGARRIAT